MVEPVVTQVDPSEVKVGTENNEGGPTGPIVEADPKDTEIAQLKEEGARKEVAFKQLKGQLAAAQRSGVSRADIEAMEERTVAFMDDLAKRIGGDMEEPTPTRQTYAEQLAAKRVEVKADPPVDPEAQKFVNYMNSFDPLLTFDDPMVQEAIADDVSPAEALKALKAAVKVKNEAATERQADEVAERKIQERFKTLGLTASGVSAPSVPALNMDGMSADQKLAEGFKQVVKKTKG